jgi:hypothetical protein
MTKQDQSGALIRSAKKISWVRFYSGIKKIKSAAAEFNIQTSIVPD